MEAAGVLDDAAHEVTAEAAGESESALEVYGSAGLEVAEVGAAVGLVDDVGRETVLVEVDGGEVATVDGDRVAEVGAPGHFLGVDDEAPGAGAPDGADLFDYAREHDYTGEPRSGPSR